MSYKKDAPTNFGLGALGASVAGFKGLFDKDLKGQGFGARLKNAGAAMGNKLLGTDAFKTQDMQAEEEGMEGLHSKLDKLLELSGQDEDGQPDVTTPPQPGSAPQVDTSALSMKANAFMGTPQQSPYSNGTGGKNSTFKKDDALRMMAVSDPDTKTSGLLFAGPPYGEKGISVNPTIKVKGEDHQGYQKANVGVESTPVPVGESGTTKLSAGVGVDSKSKKGYQSISPSAKLKLKFDIGKWWKKREEKKKEIKHDW